MLRQSLGILCVILWSCHQQGCANGDKNSTGSFKGIVNKLLDSGGGYDPTIRPLDDMGKPVRVEVDVVLITLGPLVEMEMQMTASFYLRQQWQDPRLAFSGGAVNGTDAITLDYRRSSAIWHPDLYFSQSKDEQQHDVTVPNVMLRLHPDGTLLFSQRLTVKFQCLMDLRKFPLDKQTCYIRMESYGHQADDMYFAWSSERKSMDILENAHIPDFELTEITTHDCTATYATGTYPCLEARLSLRRQIGFYMTQTYIPCILIVSLSWVSFWLDPQAVPARVSVGLLTVLTITTQSSGARSQLPRVPYTKAIDVWMSVCLVFVFAAYVQYAFVTVFARRHAKTASAASTASAQTQDINTSLSSHDSESLEVSHNDVTLTRANKLDPDSQTLVNVFTVNGKARTFSSCSSQPPLAPSEAASPRRRKDKEARLNSSALVDSWSRVCFPLSFVAFNICYWVFYAWAEDSEKA